ncbi:hypothetical protein R6Q59_032629 [Mikania micrantha]
MVKTGLGDEDVKPIGTGLEGLKPVWRGFKVWVGLGTGFKGKIPNLCQTGGSDWFGNRFENYGIPVCKPKLIFLFTSSGYDKHINRKIFNTNIIFLLVSMCLFLKHMLYLQNFVSR